MPRKSARAGAGRARLVPVLILASLAACTPGNGGRVFLLISIDTLRANRLGVYGCPEGTSPVMDRLAASSLVFTNCQSVSSWTMPAMGTLATGVRPCEHGMLYWHMPLGPVRETVAEALATRGVRSAFFGNPIPSLRGLDRGFDTWRTFEGDDGAAVEAAVSYLRRTRGDRFLWVHLLSPHAPYDPIPEYRRDQPGRDPRTLAYEGEVRTADHWVQQLLNAVGDSVAVCITADHGEALDDRKEIRFDHGAYLFEELIDIPCLLRVPGGRRGLAGEPLRLADIPATVCDWFGASPPPGAYGSSLLVVARGGTLGPRGPQFAQVVEDGPPRDKDERWSVRNGRLKAIFNLTTGSVRLFDLARDPGERRNLAADRPAEVETLRLALDAWREAGPMPPIPFDRHFTRPELERLESLGYLGGARPN